MQGVAGGSYFSDAEVRPLNRALSELLQMSENTHEKVCSMQTPFGPVVAGSTAEGSVVLTTTRAPRAISITSAASKVTHVALAADGEYLNVLVGEESGLLSIWPVHLKTLQVQGQSKVPLPSGMPISNIIPSKKGSDAWIVQDGVVTVCRNKEISQETTPFALAPNATFLAAQLLSTVHGGAEAVLAISFVSPSASGMARASAPSSSSSAAGSSSDAVHIQVYMIDLKGGLSLGQKPLMPVMEFPLSSSGRSGNSSSGSGFSLFAFGRSPQKNQKGQRERPARCEVDPDSVRSSRGGAYSFVVYVQGDQGTELSAIYLSPQHKALDRLSAGGCEIFSRPCSILAAADPLDAVVVPAASADAVQPHLPGEGELPLWRAILKLDLLPSFRADHLRGEVSRLDATAPGDTAAQDTDDRGRYFVVARSVLVEAALAAGLDHLVAAYAVQQSTDPALTSGYLLEDVRRFHEGLVGAAAGSLQAGLQSAVHALCGEGLVRRLLAESEASFAVVVAELKELQDVAAGLQLVTEALLSRKVQALADHGPAADDDDGAMDDVLQSVIAEGQSALQVQIAELRCLQKVVGVLIEVARTPGLSFRSLLTGGLHQRHTSGRIHAASSSSAAAASALLSEYHYTRAQRTERATQARDLPDCLRAGPEGLLGVLCSMLLPGCQPAVEFLLHSGGSALGVNLGSLGEAITAVLLLPLSALRQAASNNGDRSAVDLSRLTNASTVAFSVLAFFLAEMLHLSAVDGAEAGGAQRGADGVALFVQRVCSAAGVATTVRNGVLAVWQIESGIHVAQAMSTICRIQDCTISQDEVMLCAVIRQLLSAAHLSECQVLLNFLRRSDHAIVGTEFFVLATAVGVCRADQWKMCWYSAKELSHQVRGEGAEGGEDSTAASLRRQLVHLFVHHAMQHDAMGDLLNSPLDTEEVREVEAVLRALAESDVQNCRCPSPAVDVCVAFLLREAKFGDAIELHERHASALDLVSQSGEWVEAAKVQLEDRRALILAHASVPTIHVECFRS